MQEHKSFLIRDLLGDVLSERVHGEFFTYSLNEVERSKSEIFNLE